MNIRVYERHETILTDNGQVQFIYLILFVNIKHLILVSSGEMESDTGNFRFNIHFQINSCQGK